MARVLRGLSQRVLYDASVVPSTTVGDLGFMNPTGSRRRPAAAVPLVPVSGVVRGIANEVMDQAISRGSVPRDPSLQKIAPSSASDADLLSTPKCPESCFRQMEVD